MWFLVCPVMPSASWMMLKQNNNHSSNNNDAIKISSTSNIDLANVAIG